MAMYNFGAGTLIAIPKIDSTGTTVSNPTPLKVLTIQGFSMDESFDSKTLYGQGQFPERVARGKGSVKLKVASGRLDSALWNDTIGGTLTSGTLTSIVIDSTGQAVPATPFQVTVTPPNAGTFATDMGVTDSAGVPYTRVAATPATLEYTVTAGGVYEFAAADEANVVFINYKYTASVAGASTADLTNVDMGIQPEFEFNFVSSYQGKTVTAVFPRCQVTSFKQDFKNEDFTIPEFDVECFNDDTTQIIRTISTQS